MKLSQLAAKPQLIKLVLDTPEVLETYSEPLEFWTWDRQPMDIFLKLAALDQNNNVEMFEMIRSLILDEDGQAIIRDESVLPTRIMLAAVNVIVESLGK
jgi:hypothetical protein